MKRKIILLLLLALAAAHGQLADPRDGKQYRIVIIGTQTWMAENLNYNAKGSKCYDNKESNCQKYGRLYDWNTAMKACPGGWHLPSDTDWNVLMKLVNPSCSDNSSCAGAGTKLKATSGWNKDGDKSGNGTDEYGFSALPGGRGGSDGKFNDVGSYGGCWSSSDYDDDYAFHVGMGNYYEYAYWNDYDKSYLFGVRCLKD